MGRENAIVIDALQYCNWSRDIFQQLRDGGVTAVHVTVSYWESFRETVENIARWNRWFEDHSDLIMPVRTGADVRRAQAESKTGVVFGFQNCSPIDDDFRLVQIVHDLGGRFMQLSYNNQSLLATGCYEAEDPGITRFGKQIIREMNRVGMVIDMSHSAERSTLEAIEISERPIAITHANPASWVPRPAQQVGRCAQGARPKRRHAGAQPLPPSPAPQIGLHIGRFLRHGGGDGGTDGHRAHRHRLRPLPGA